MSGLKELAAGRELLTNLTLRELRGKYKRTALGWAWSMLNPLSTIVIYSIVFGKSTTKDQDYEAEFTDRSLWDGRAFVLASALYELDSTERFFGFGNSRVRARSRTTPATGCSPRRHRACGSFPP